MGGDPILQRGGGTVQSGTSGRRRSIARHGGIAADDLAAWNRMTDKQGVKSRLPLLLVLFCCGLSPLAAILLITLRDSASMRPGKPGFDWPSWRVGTPPREQIIDPVEISAAVIFCGAAWLFGRIIRQEPGSRIFWPFWGALFLSGLALVNMGRLHTGFAAILGFAFLAKAYDWKKKATA